MICCLFIIGKRNKERQCEEVSMEKISIIIPVYNAEKTIRRCLESIIVSEYEEYEVILIDDGSTDNSASIISEYASKDSRFKMISQANAGPSSARNKGLSLSTGDIIVFVDSDDYIRNDYLGLLARTFEEKNVDVVFIEFHCVAPNGTELSIQHLPQMAKDYYTNLMTLSEADMFGYTWIKAFRKELSQNIYFDTDINLFEDEIFTCKILEKPIKLFYLNEAVYYYVRMEGSLVQRTHKEYCRLCDRVFHAWKHLLEMTPNGAVYLEKKANCIAEACKYYGLERKINPFVFYREMANSDFIKFTTSKDLLITAIKQEKWCRVIWEHVKYNIKVAIAKQRRDFVRN